MVMHSRNMYDLVRHFVKNTRSHAGNHHMSMVRTRWKYSGTYHPLFCLMFFIR